ncbi:MAG: alpha-L-fucosidase, partial [Spirochaetaceae bacterium]
MDRLLSKPEYERWTAETRDARMKWWREARFGMFVHYGLYSQLGQHEWAMSVGNFPIAEYEKLAESFTVKPGAPREWAALAKKAGMKYVVMTTRHHEGFSLWDSKANPYNSVNHGPKRDIVREFVDACREFELGIGFYSSLMDWHHPDSWRCAFDPAARARFLEFIEAMNTELLTQYGKIDILWYDVPRPMEHWEGWDSVARNQRLRKLQPDLIINNRSLLDEDFGTPEEHVTPSDRDWEACMTFNGISWGYVDSAQAGPYSYNAHRIVRMLQTCAGGCGNLLLNIGPTPDGGVPEEAVEPLETVGRWLAKNGEGVYGAMDRDQSLRYSGVCGASRSGKTVYLWNWIWPESGTLYLGGIQTPVARIRIVGSSADVAFRQEGHRVILENLPSRSPDDVLGIAMIAIEFKSDPSNVAR